MWGKDFYSQKKAGEAQDGFIAFQAHISYLEIQRLLLTPVGFQSCTLSGLILGGSITTRLTVQPGDC